jgi:hypothetical protein
MALFFPIASGIAAAFTVALTYETGQNAKRKFEKKRTRRAAKKL